MYCFYARIFRRSAVTQGNGIYRYGIGQLYKCRIGALVVYSVRCDDDRSDIFILVLVSNVRKCGGNIRCFFCIGIDTVLDQSAAEAVCVYGVLCGELFNYFLFFLFEAAGVLS
ncbi:hypothetical protein D3C72_917570 [compost metagenome]